MKRLRSILWLRLPFLLWGLGSLFFVLAGFWSFELQRREEDRRCNIEAGRIAAQMAALLTVPVWEMDVMTVRSVILASMEDDSLYAVRVDSLDGTLEGQRRNHHWEAVPWDDEITVSAVQAASPLLLEGRHVGMVEIYLSTRMRDEGLAQIVRREVWRFMLSIAMLSFLLGLCCWRKGVTRAAKNE